VGEAINDFCDLDSINEDDAVCGINFVYIHAATAIVKDGKYFAVAAVGGEHAEIATHGRHFGAGGIAGYEFAGLPNDECGEQEGSRPQWNQSECWGGGVGFWIIHCDYFLVFMLGGHRILP